MSGCYVSEILPKEKKGLFTFRVSQVINLDFEITRGDGIFKLCKQFEIFIILNCIIHNRFSIPKHSLFMRLFDES